MSTHRKLMTICCAAVLALGLAACGSSSDSDRAATGGGTTLPEVTLASLQGGTEIPAGTYRITGDADDLTGLYEAVVDFGPDVLADGYAPGDPAVEVGGLMLMCSARSEENCTLSIDEDAGTITVTGLFLVAAQGGEFPDDRTAEQKTADRRAENTRVAMAISSTATIGALGNTDVFFVVDGGAVTERPTTPTDTDDDFAKSDDGPAALDGFAGAIYERGTDDAGRDPVMVVTYTDIEPPADQAYLDYYAVGTGTDQAGSRDAVTNADADGVLDIDEADIGGNHGLFMFAFPLTAEDQTKTVSDDTETADVDEREFMGTFNGIPGTLACTEASCTVSSDGEGNLSVLTGTWTFTPTDAGTAMVAGVVPDSDYLDFGYWVLTKEAADGTVSYSVGTYEAGTAYGSVASVEGMANYAGKAAGLYAQRTFDTQGGTNPSASGQFVADVNLTAYFGGDDVSPNNANSISGTVTNFKGTDGSEVGTGWSLSLNKIGGGSGGEGTFATDSGTLTDGKTTTGDEGAADGAWSGMFRGDDSTGDQPGGVTGIFTGHFTDGDVAGAFGARKTD